jgi:carboxymethylenebutenolidase
MAEKIKELIREYKDGRITRREFMRRAVVLTGSLVTANLLMDNLAHSPAYAAEVDPNDPTLLCRNVEFSGRATTVFGYLARPAAQGKFPAIIVIHANQGLNDYTRDVARRFAKQGYVSLAVDYLSRHGGTEKVNPKGEGLSNIRDLAPWYGVAEDTESGFALLRTFPDVRADRQGLIGFCWGGEMTFSSITEVRGSRQQWFSMAEVPSPLISLKTFKHRCSRTTGKKIQPSTRIFQAPQRQ